MKNYTKIDFWSGSIDQAVSLLDKHKKEGSLVYIEFNGVNIYSDIDDLDSSYQKITGKTKHEFESHRNAEIEKYKEEEEKYKQSIPQLTKEWIEKGKSILDEKYHDLWIKCVPIRLRDLYRGFELGCCLDIVKELNSGGSLDRAKEIIVSQGHSGMSHGLVLSMIRSFCERGDEFSYYISNDKT